MADDNMVTVDPNQTFTLKELLRPIMLSNDKTSVTFRIDTGKRRQRIIEFGRMGKYGSFEPAYQEQFSNIVVPIEQLLREHFLPSYRERFPNRVVMTLRYNIKKNQLTIFSETTCIIDSICYQL